MEVPKKSVERLDSIKSLQELDLGENVYMKNSILVDCVETLNSPDAAVSSDNVEMDKNSGDDDGIGVPVVLRNFLRRFSETNGVSDDAPAPQVELR